MLGRLVASLEATGELENTYIFFSSDHGFLQGEHRLWNQKWRAYEETIRVPLIVRGPGVPAGQPLQHMVLNNDLAPTFAALTGASTPDFVDGRSLNPLLTATPPSQASWRSAFLTEGRHGSSAEEYEAVRTKEHLYVEYKTGERELYDLRTDPYQLNNQYATADPALVAQLHRRLETLRYCTTESCRSAEDSAADTVAPTIVNTMPSNGASGTAVSAGVTATFSEAMDASTIDGSTFTLSAQGAGSPVAASVSYDPATMKATLKPTSALQANTTYVAEVTTGAKDLSGNALAAERGWSFTTAIGACTITGTSAAETLTGTFGDDVICGGDGNDTIKGEGGNDTIKGEGGNDKLFGGEGADTMDGGLGTDTASYYASTTPITASLATNSSTGQGADAFLSVESLSGGSKADSLTGSAANNRLAGSGGNDAVVGNGGADLLYGEAGDDSVNSRDGVSGNDSLDGGTHVNGDTAVTDATEKSVVGFP